MSKLYVVIDIGCHECGVSSEVVGAYKTRKSAEKNRIERSLKTKQWRNGGQSIPKIFEVEL